MFIPYVLFLFTATISAQTYQEEIELFQSIFGMEKKAMVSAIVKLDGDQSAAFWSLYDEYESARKSHGQKRIKLIVNYAESYENLTDEKTADLMKEMQALSKEYDKLMKTYFKKFSKTVNAKTAAQFYQVEIYIQAAIRLAIFEHIPFIGELE